MMDGEADAFPGGGLLNAALGYARRGLRVLPLHHMLPHPRGGMLCSCGKTLCTSPGKHPLPRLTPKGLTEATSDDRRIRRWWSVAPSANIGLTTGALIVLDVDPRHGGDGSLAGLERQQGPLPTTWRVLTGGGGEHVYFAAGQVEIRNSAGRLGPGLDIRGSGGYVVAPPSIHKSGRPYAWSVDHHPDHVPLARVPGWMERQLTNPTTTARAGSGSGWPRLVSEGVANGMRNQTLARLTGLLLRRYIDPLVALELLLAWNEARCRPPLDGDEVSRIVNSIARRELRRREARRGQPG